MSDTTLPPLPLVLTAAGRQPSTPATMNALIIALAQELVPGLTANLPASLIDDVSGTDTAALVLIDQAVTELINSLTPVGANWFLLVQLGALVGVALGLASNNSVYVVFSGSVGFPIPIGFTVSDGTYQYTVQDPGIVGSGGSSAPIFCIATTAGSWAIPIGTVTGLITSLPDDITLTVTNQLAGLPGAPPQSAASYRSDVLQAGLAVSQGMTTLLKTALRNVPGVQSNLVSVRQQPLGYEVIVGGGDPYQVANAIFTTLFWLPGLVGSTLAITGITQASPGVVTTNLNHGFATGQTGVILAGIVGMTQANGGPYTITVVDEKNFSLGIDTTGFSAYVSGGVVTPNVRNLVVSIPDFPDTYEIPIVLPPQQTVTISLLWNTAAPNLVSTAAVAALGQPALISYVNSLSPGQPMNLFVMQSLFQVAVATLISPQHLSRMVWAISINGVSTPPVSGTGDVVGDSESYFLATAASVTISQG